MATHDEIKEAYESYVAEQEAFETKGVKAAAARARKACLLDTSPSPRDRG